MAVQYIAAAGVQIGMAYLQSGLMKQQYALQNEINKYNIANAEYNNWQQRGYMQRQLGVARQQQIQQEASQQVAMAAAGIDTNAEGSISDLTEQNRRTSMFNRMDLENRMVEQINNQGQQIRNMQLGAQQQYASGMTQASSVLAGGIMSGISTGLKAIDYSGFFKDETAPKTTLTQGAGLSDLYNTNDFNVRMMG